jgi:hypothetical protein
MGGKEVSRQHVWVYGPNLQDQSKGQMHVHKAGCADTKRGQYPNVDPPWSIVDATSMKSVVHDIYPPGQFEYDGDTEWKDFASDINFFPCVTLPEE